MKRSKRTTAGIPPKRYQQDKPANLLHQCKICSQDRDDASICSEKIKCNSCNGWTHKSCLHCTDDTFTQFSIPDIQALHWKSGPGLQAVPSMVDILYDKCNNKSSPSFTCRYTHFCNVNVTFITETRQTICNGKNIVENKNILPFGLIGKNRWYSALPNNSKNEDRTYKFDSKSETLKETRKSEDKNVEEKVEPESSPSILQRFKIAYKEYGKVLVGVHVVTSLMWYSSFYYAAKSGIDVIPLLKYLGAGETIIRPFQAGAGNFAVGYLLYKIATPARYAVTIGGTQLTVKQLRKLGYMVAPSEEDSIKNLMKDGRTQMKDKLDDMKDNVDDMTDKFKDNLKDKVEGYKEKRQKKS